MTGPELLEVIRAMTPPPWRYYGGPIEAGIVAAPASDVAPGARGEGVFEGCGGCCQAPWAEVADLTAIVVLANHAQQIADLVRAAEQLKAWRDDEERSAADLDTALDSIMAALDRVHAVRATPGATANPHRGERT